jgi:ATP-dependent phosphofructokinase / diphosphate-dependent phosphofructokinase
MFKIFLDAASYLTAILLATKHQNWLKVGFKFYKKCILIILESLLYHMSKKRIGITNSGGDCPGLNTVIDAVVCGLYPDYEILGFYKGFEGLLDQNYIYLTPEFTGEKKFDGGTFLKSVNKGRFAGKVGLGTVRQLDSEIISQTINNYNELGLDGLVVLGGDGTMSTALQLQEHGINIIGVPKSIDNDLTGTDVTFGFHTAVEITTEAMDRIATTAKSHDRIIVLEVMGRHAGWIALYTGIAGGADCILIPEIIYDQQKLANHFIDRYKRGLTSGLIVIAEGALEKHSGQSLLDNVSSINEVRLGGAAETLVNYLGGFKEIETRSTVLGHIQRGGSPNSWDRILSRMFGSYAAKMVRENKYGRAVAYQNGKFTDNNIEVYAEHLKLVNPNSDFVLRAKEMGIYFGE